MTNAYILILMFRLLARNIVINLASIYLVTKVLSGVFVIEGGASKFLLAALAISIINLILRPIINLLLLPINLMTLGFTRWLANVGVLYVATKLVPQMHVLPFISPMIELPFIIIPSITFSAFGAFIYVSFILAVIFHVVYWIFQE